MIIAKMYIPIYKIILKSPHIVFILPGPGTCGSHYNLRHKNYFPKTVSSARIVT